MFELPRIPIWAPLLAVLGSLMAVGCDSRTYHSGTPPGDAVVSVGEPVLDTVHDSLDRRSLRLVVESRWEIDAEDFGSRSYSHGIVFGYSYGWIRVGDGWKSPPLPKRILRPVDSLRDTLWCVADTCTWPNPEVHVMVDLRAGRFLSVASQRVPFVAMSDP